MLALDDTRRNAPTQPPPPPAIAELEAIERECAHRASRDMARARECRAMIEMLSGKPRNDLERHAAELAAELEAIESGCVDSDDPRHPNHPLHCQRPCCRRDEP